MKNVEMKVEDNILTIKIDLTKQFGPSSSERPLSLHRLKEILPLTVMKGQRSG